MQNDPACKELINFELFSLGNSIISITVMVIKGRENNERQFSVIDIQVLSILLQQHI